MALDVNPDREFTIAVFPDTQYYVDNNNGIFEGMADWVVNNKDTYNIQAFMHVGDMKETYGTASAEWDIVEDAVGRIKSAGIPCVLGTGNHDANENGDARNLTTFRNRFPTNWYEGMASNMASVLEIGTYDGNPENVYLVVEIQGERMLLMAAEMAPRDAVMDWMVNVLNKHADKPAGLVTHSFLNYDGTRVSDSTNHHPSGWIEGSDLNDGDDMWNGWLKDTSNLAFVINGHHHNSDIDMNAHRSDDTSTGEVVTQMFHNYQMFTANGGDGHLRLLAIDPVDWTAEAHTYSTENSTWKTGSETRFDFNYRYHWLDSYASVGKVRTGPLRVADGGTTLSKDSNWGDGTFAAGVDLANGAVSIVESLPDYVIAQWLLDETSGSTATDEIGSRDATISGTVTQGVSAPRGTGYSFEGGYLDLGTGAFNLSQGTVVAWVYLDDTTSRHTIFGQDAGGVNDGDFRFLVGDGSTGNASAGDLVVSQQNNGNSHSIVGPNVPTGTWTRVAVSFGSGSGGPTLHVDGTAGAQSDGTSDTTIEYPMSNTSAPTNIGAYGNGSDVFAGDMAEVIVADSVLTQSEIADL